MDGAKCGNPVDGAGVEAHAPQRERETWTEAEDSKLYYTLNAMFYLDNGSMYLVNPKRQMEKDDGSGMDHLWRQYWRIYLVMALDARRG